MTALTADEADVIESYRRQRMRSGAGPIMNLVIIFPVSKQFLTDLPEGAEGVIRDMAGDAAVDAVRRAIRQSEVK